MIGEKCNFIVFFRISLIINKDEVLSICLLAIYASPLQIRGLPICILCQFFSIEVVICLSLEIYKRTYILQILILGLYVANMS